LHFRSRWHLGARLKGLSSVRGRRGTASMPHRVCGRSAFFVNTVAFLVSDPELSEDQIEQIQETWENIKSATDREAYDGVNEILSVASETPSRVTTPLIRKIQPSGQRASMYETFELPKRRGGTRTISSPNQPIQFLQHSFLRVCTYLFPRHDCAYGFERGRSHISNAAQHVDREWVYSLDIENFFPTIHWGRVYGMLQTHPVHASSDVARILANLCTNDGCLPQGAPTSPILSNLLCRKLDSRLFRWAQENGYTYTRYADDLTLSTKIGFLKETGHSLKKSSRMRGLPLTRRRSVSCLLTLGRWSRD